MLGRSLVEVAAAVAVVVVLWAAVEASRNAAVVRVVVICMLSSGFLIDSIDLWWGIVCRTWIDRECRM